MPRYHTLGKIPPKRHTVFKNDDEKFYYEELFGTIGFDGMSSLLYHTQRPTQVKEILRSYDISMTKYVICINKKALISCSNTSQLHFYLSNRTLSFFSF